MINEIERVIQMYDADEYTRDEAYECIIDSVVKYVLSDDGSEWALKYLESKLKNITM
ncbi:gp101.1 [Bacillus phage W.Ph.]|uniref:Gp101.1 n=1 Tax=Bacillus phage W.Ph. TaxID=764595 RepID=L7UYL0_9CAUD|nr:gp101.1 [Bacillus phage W.Ph.]AGC55703.1 gp101.1 [Bacillus phage W.Ph.]